MHVRSHVHREIENSTIAYTSSAPMNVKHELKERVCTLPNHESGGKTYWHGGKKETMKEQIEEKVLMMDYSLCLGVIMS